MEKGTVVVSKAGRDKGYLLCVVNVSEEDGHVLVCDGRERPLERPKKKNPRHIEPVDCPGLTWELRGNKALRKAINRLSNKSLGDKLAQ